MRLIVTGACGFIGRLLVEKLAAHGHSGLASGRTPPGNLPQTWEAVGRADLLHSHAHADLGDAIIHLEVKHHVSRPGPKDVEEFEKVNVAGTRDWLAWASAHGIRRFVFVSSVKAVEHFDGTYFENAPPETVDPYGRSKALAEVEVRAWANTNFDRTAAILRFAPVYGPGNEANFASFARQVIRGRPCLIGPGEARKSVLSRENAVAAIEFVLKMTSGRCETFNVSDNGYVTMAELARWISEAAHAPRPRKIPRIAAAVISKFGDGFERLTGRTFPLNSRNMRTLTHDSVFPVDKLRGAGFEHVQTTKEGIRHMAEWLVEHGG